MTNSSIDRSTPHGCVSLLALAFTLSACIGNLGGGDGDGSSPADDTGGSSSSGGPGSMGPGETLKCDANAVDPGPSPMRLLSTPAEVRSAMPKLGFIHAELAEEFGLPVGDAPMRLRA